MVPPTLFDDDRGTDIQDQQSSPTAASWPSSGTQTHAQTDELIESKRSQLTIGHLESYSYSKTLGVIDAKYFNLK